MGIQLHPTYCDFQISGLAAVLQFWFGFVSLSHQFPLLDFPTDYVSLLNFITWWTYNTNIRQSVIHSSHWNWYFSYCWNLSLWWIALISGPFGQLRMKEGSITESWVWSWTWTQDDDNFIPKSSLIQMSVPSGCAISDGNTLASVLWREETRSTCQQYVAPKFIPNISHCIKLKLLNRKSSKKRSAKKGYKSFPLVKQPRCSVVNFALTNVKPNIVVSAKLKIHFL